MAGFEIDGERYEMPTFDTLTLAECRVLYKLTDPPIVQEDFEWASPDWDEERRREHVEANVKRMERPDFKAALAAIAYRRRHPEVTIAEAGAKADEANGVEVTVAFVLGGDERDPTSPSSSVYRKLLESVSSSSPPEITEDSGSSSERSGTAPDTSPETTGTTGSDTSPPGAPPTGPES